MKIGLVFDGDYPWDVRVWKVARCLGDHGHEVHIVCRNLARRTEEEAAAARGVHSHGAGLPPRVRIPRTQRDPLHGDVADLWPRAPTPPDRSG